MKAALTKIGGLFIGLIFFLSFSAPIVDFVAKRTLLTPQGDLLPASFVSPPVGVFLFALRMSFFPALLAGYLSNTVAKNKYWLNGVVFLLLFITIALWTVIKWFPAEIHNVGKVKTTLSMGINQIMLCLMAFGGFLMGSYLAQILEGTILSSHLLLFILLLFCFLHFTHIADTITLAMWSERLPSGEICTPPYKSTTRVVLAKLLPYLVVGMIATILSPRWGPLHCLLAGISYSWGLFGLVAVYYARVVDQLYYSLWVVFGSILGAFLTKIIIHISQRVLQFSKQKLRNI